MSKYQCVEIIIRADENDVKKMENVYPGPGLKFVGVSEFICVSCGKGPEKDEKWIYNIDLEKVCCKRCYDNQ